MIRPFHLCCDMNCSFLLPYARKKQNPPPKKRQTPPGEQVAVDFHQLYP